MYVCIACIMYVKCEDSNKAERLVRCICMQMCIYIHKYICIYIYIYTYIHTCINMYVMRIHCEDNRNKIGRSILVHVHMRMEMLNTCIHAYIHTYKNMLARGYQESCQYVHAYVCIRTHTHTHTNTNIHCKNVSKKAGRLISAALCLCMRHTHTYIHTQT
jgi:hypothetical protein